MNQKEFQNRFGGTIKGKWLIYEGNLYCSFNSLKVLPDNLQVGGEIKWK